MPKTEELPRLPVNRNTPAPSPVRPLALCEVPNVRSLRLEPKTEVLPLERIVADSSVQSRSTLQAATVDDYVERYQDECDMPDLIVFCDESEDVYWLRGRRNPGGTYVPRVQVSAPAVWCLLVRARAKRDVRRWRLSQLSEGNLTAQKGARQTAARRRKNVYIDAKGVTHLAINRQSGESVVFVIDNELRAACEQQAWKVQPDGTKKYAMTDYYVDAKRYAMSLQQFVWLQTGGELERPIKFVNDNSLDCRRANLQLGENVYLNPQSQRWMIYVYRNGKGRFEGQYPSKQDGEEARSMKQEEIDAAGHSYPGKKKPPIT